MRTRRERFARIIVTASWIGGIGLALRLGIASSEPMEVFGLLVVVYLSVWGLAFFLCPNATTTNAARFLLVTLGIGLAISLFEAPALIGRVDYRDIFQTPTASWRRHGHRPDPELIYVRDGGRHERLKFVGGELAGLSRVGAKKVYHSDVRYDAQGFRNRQVLDKADIVVVGDSFVEGLHVDDADLLTTQLANATSLSVANLGRSGDGPQQERYVLARFGIPKKPKLCLWLFYEGNDLDDAAEYEANRATVSALGPVSLSRVVYERSFLRNALMFARRAWVAPQKTRPAAQFQGAFVSRDLGTITMTFASDDHRRTHQPQRVQKAAAAIRDAATLCQNSGVKFVVVFVPSKLRVYRDFCRFPDDSTVSAVILSDLPRLLRESIGDVPLVDLTDSLRESAAQGELVYLPDDTHWSASGHAVAARACAREVTTRRQAVTSLPRP